jgi:hypothetical protein
MGRPSVENTRTLPRAVDTVTDSHSLAVVIVLLGRLAVACVVEVLQVSHVVKAD